MLVLAGGSGTRLGAATNKVYLPLAGRSVIAHSLLRFAATPGVERLVLVARPSDHELVRAVLDELPPDRVEVVAGGSNRHLSELAGLRHLAAAITAGDLDVVAIHDGARPLVTRELISKVLATAAEQGGAIPGIPVTDLVAKDDLHTDLTEAGGTLVRVQTPQAFRAAELLDAYERSAAEDFAGTDTSACVEKFTDLTVVCVPGDPGNLKVTYAADLPLAEELLSQR
ncbi:IspD/TarI family cytidylyltransferase [Fodinicola feengrottensis]|uniref:IspD/TarI family cytidylyltransferase n=1 Tax=Fodinicola feengrottensis TaxID=435914 RepID=A0ABN2IGP1_9ACTN